MAQMNVLEALRAAMGWALEHDPDVVILGEDVGTAGGIFRATEGLQNLYGPDRVIDTPMDESGIVAHAVGLALAGMKPIAEIQFSGFIHNAHEQIMFCAAKYRWMSGGEFTNPLVIRAPSFGGIKGGVWHSQSPESYYVHGGGIKIIAPATRGDAYGMMLAAIRDPDPVLILEPVPLYRSLSGEVEDNGEEVAIGPAEIVREGSDITVVTWGPLRHVVQKTADELATSNGFETEVIDLKTIIPWDVECVAQSVMRTGRLVVIHEAPQTLGFGAEIVTEIQSRCFGYLQAPIDRVCSPDLPYSYRVGDEFYKPGEARIRASLLGIMEFTF